MHCIFFFFQAEDGIRDLTVTGVQTCALPISPKRLVTWRRAIIARAAGLRRDDTGVVARGEASYAAGVRRRSRRAALAADPARHQHGHQRHQREQRHLHVDEPAPGPKGPLFIMEKRKNGYDRAHGDWHYSIVDPVGTVTMTASGMEQSPTAFS